MMEQFPGFKLDEHVIVFEDDYLLVINKPPGMLVHPTVSESGTTLYDYVKAYYFENNINADIHPVSRLDRNTSGLVLFAKEPIIQFWLSQREIAKEYLAIVEGIPPEKDGFIEAPIARKEGSIIERCVDFEHGKTAKTHYQVLQSDGSRSLVKLRLYTGRTHQIRVHMAYIGCPLVKDNLYGTPGPMDRHSLHAWKLSFIHPVSDEPLEITCELPEDLQKLLP